MSSRFSPSLFDFRWVLCIGAIAMASSALADPPKPPEIAKVKDLCLNTEIVKEGRPNATIIVPASGVYREQAERIVKAVEQATGARLPVATDDSPEASVPLTGNVIALGNRSTSKFVGDLYNRCYTLLDLRYPGPEGYNVRTLHNPFGSGCNVVFVGGSDLAGVEAATDVFIRKLSELAKGNSLTIGWVAEIKLGKGVRVPTDLKEFETWEASHGYGSIGYFGWNSISKRMAMYYMTGDPFHAREALRLAFPDAQALKEISEIDGERIEDKPVPLSGPYHYNAHMMILYWDLIEESPVFTDAERLRVTQAFTRQLCHPSINCAYVEDRRTTPSCVGSRHGQWAAISLYCLGRYFQTYYPDPIWRGCVESGIRHFRSLHNHAWVSGENDNLFWYNTATAPVLSYMLLTGDRVPLQKGTLQQLLRGQEILISGRVPDWALNSAALDFLHKAAYLTQDGRWIEYRNRTGMDLDVFRLGQSYWPEEHLKPVLPEDLVGKWSINPLPEPMWKARNSGIKLEESFLFMSYRSRPDAGGDFILLDGFNGASRNPYHTFAVLELRLGGETVLQGYLNQVLTKADGMVEPKVAMDAAMKHCDVLGDTVVAIAEVPGQAYCNWRRNLVQRVGRYALVTDDLTFRTDSENIEVETKWETQRGITGASGPDQRVRLRGMAATALPPGWIAIHATENSCASSPAGDEALKRLDAIRIMLLRATSPGTWIEMPFQLKEKTQGEVLADLVNYTDRGTVRILLDGAVVCERFDHYAPDVVPVQVSLGQRELAAGEHRLRVEVVAKRPDAEKCYVGLGGVSIRLKGAPPVPKASDFVICGCDPVRGAIAGSCATAQWLGPAKNGQHRIFFSLIATEPVGSDAVKCLRVADNAAALALPAPAIAVAGGYETVQGELTLLAGDHLFARAAQRVGGMLVSDKPVDVDWDFSTGKAHVVAVEAVRLGLAVEGSGAVRINSAETAGVAGEGGMMFYNLPKGRHTIDSAIANKAILVETARFLSAKLEQGMALRRQVAQGAAPAKGPAAPELRIAGDVKLEGPIICTEVIPSAQGNLLCAAEGQTIHVLSAEGKEIRAMKTDGPVRVLRWWEQPKLLLAGCVDEKVIAFDEAGNRKWVFVSEMDPDVLKAAKTYWFKTAPGHEGIHGLSTGVYLDGKSQAFVGSACTLEILGEDGKLAKRKAVFWGCGSQFNLLNRPDGSTDLLIARQPTDGHALAIISNRVLEAEGRAGRAKTGMDFTDTSGVRRGFDGVPAGHTYVGGWACMSRKHIFHDDLDGDGKKEIASEINGTWNRITVWSEEGVPLSNAQFGPGKPIPVQNIRDVDIADLNGDGKKEIVVATSGGMLVVLDCKCQKVWAKRLPRPAGVLHCAAPAGGAPWILVGCEDGALMVFDGKGNLVRVGSVAGEPTVIAPLADASGGKLVAIGTKKGDVKIFTIAN